MKLGDYTLRELAENCKANDECKSCCFSEKIDWGVMWYYDCNLKEHFGMQMNPDEWLDDEFFDTEITEEDSCVQDG